MATEILPVATSSGHGDPIGSRGVVVGTPDSDPRLTVVASPTASYLLPDLVPMHGGISVGTTETGHANWVTIAGGTVVIAGSFRHDDILERQRWSDLKLCIDRVTARLAAQLEPEPSAVPAAPERGVEKVPTEIQPLASDASVQAIASQIGHLSGMSDTKLAHLFGVTRETFNRWRSGAMTNPTAGARRRLGMVMRLLEELAGRGVSTSDWLSNATGVAGSTPYDLISQGRIDEAAFLATSAGTDQTLMRQEPIDEEPLIFEEDEGWQSFDIEVTDDER